MQKVSDEETFGAWVSTCVAMTLLYLVGLDTLLCLAYAKVFQSLADLQNGAALSGLLVGNTDLRSRL